MKIQITNNKGEVLHQNQILKSVLFTYNKVCSSSHKIVELDKQLKVANIIEHTSIIILLINFYF